MLPEGIDAKIGLRERTNQPTNSARVYKRNFARMMSDVARSNAVPALAEFKYA